MPINQKLVDNLIACTQLNANLVAGLNTPAIKGPIPSAASLADIASHVEVSNLTPSENADTSHARPTMLASISSFVENVKAACDAVSTAAQPGAYQNLSPIAKQNFAEWQGMIAVVALCNIYSVTGLNLSVKEIRMDGSGNAAIRCVLMELEKDRNYREAVKESQGVLYYICQNEKPFAVFHPEIGLCPMREYDSGIFEGVIPWYREVPNDCHAGWGDILTLDTFCLSRVAHWAKINDQLIYQAYLEERRGPFAPLPDALERQDSVADASIIESVWPKKGIAFGTAVMAYLDERQVARRMPDVFLDKMMISSIGSGENNKMVYNTAAEKVRIQFQNDDGILTAFAPVPPFNPTIMDVLGSCSLGHLDFFADLDGQRQLKGVRVELTINTSTGELHTAKTYDYQHLCLGQMPYLMLWPFVPMPTGIPLWKSYYATWHDQLQDLSPLKGADGKLISIVDGKMGFEWGTQGTTHSVCCHTAVNDAWRVCVGSEPLRYAILTKTDVVSGTMEDLGLVFMPKYPEFSPMQGKPVGINPVKLAVDFGTTSTMCAMSSPMFDGVTEVALPFKDYSCCATCEDEKAKKIVNTMNWLGNEKCGPSWKWDQKLFSVAQLFDQLPTSINRMIQGQAGSQKYYIDGRLFLTSGDVLAALAGKAKGGADLLKAQQIMNDMKFNHALDVENYHAASIFLAGVYLYAILYLLSEKIIPTPGTDFVKLLVSYPNDVTLDALKQNWQFARDILSTIVDGSLLNPINTMLVSADQFFNEATATTAYQRRPGAPVSFTSDLVSLDIGGGTSDISISNEALHPGDVRNLSVRYAGREIMVTSLVELYRKVNPATPSVIDESSFSRLWSSESGILWNQFNALCSTDDPNRAFLHSLTKNSTLRMDVELLLAQGMNLGPASNMNPTNLLRQLIAMKFIMLLRVVADMVRENIDMWVNPKTKELNLIGDRLEINLSVSGTGAQMLQYIFDCSMPQLVNLQIPEALDGTTPMAQCLNMMNTAFDEELRGVLPVGVHTSLKIYVDPDVAQKLDVSYGMLQPGIELLTPKKPAATAAVLVPGFPVAAAPVGSMPAAVREEKRLEMEARVNSYHNITLAEYIEGKKDAAGNVVHHGLMDYWKWYEQIFFPAPIETNRGLGPKVNTMSSLMERTVYMPFFTAARTAVAKGRSGFMIEPEQTAFIDQFIGMYMVEELLDWVIAQSQ